MNTAGCMKKRKPLLFCATTAEMEKLRTLQRPKFLGILSGNRVSYAVLLRRIAEPQRQAALYLYADIYKKNVIFHDTFKNQIEILEININKHEKTTEVLRSLFATSLVSFAV